MADHAQVTFVSPDGIWAIRFGNAPQYAAFTEQYNDKLFENTFKVDNDETNRNKVRTPHSGMQLLHVHPSWEGCSAASELPEPPCRFSAKTRS
jgi:allophanate hydrolase subunit 2